MEDFLKSLPSYNKYKDLKLIVKNNNMSNAVQLRERSVIKLNIGGLVTDITKGKFRSATEKHEAEDKVLLWINSLLEEGLSDYDIVRLANDVLKDRADSVTVCDVDGVWRLKIKLADKKYITVSKQDVIELAVEEYKKRASEALHNY